MLSFHVRINIDQPEVQRFNFVNDEVFVNDKVCASFALKTYAQKHSRTYSLTFILGRAASPNKTYNEKEYQHKGLHRHVLVKGSKVTRDANQISFGFLHINFPVE